MQVNNQMLSLSGSLLKDPHNPPPPPEAHAFSAAHHSPSPSPEPMLPPRPAKKARRAKQPVANGHANGHAEAEVYDPELQPHPENLEHPAVAGEFLSAREQKQKRKEEQRALRDEKKRRKEEKQLQGVEVEAGGDMIEAAGTERGAGMEDVAAAAGIPVEVKGGKEGKKRKTENGEAKEGKKKRKKDA